MLVRIAIILLLPIQLFAATRYASPSGSGTACTNQGTPCSLTTALSQGVAGDEVVLLDGTYATSMNPPNNGALGNPIVIRSLNKWGARIDGTGQSSALLIARNYLTFRDIDFDGNNSAQNTVSFQLGASGTTRNDIIIEGCRIRNGRWINIRLGFGTVTDAEQFNIIIRHNSIHHVGTVDNPTGGEGEALYIGHMPVVGADAVDQYHDIEIYGNDVWDFTDNGLDIKDTASRVSVHDNLFRLQLFASDYVGGSFTNSGTIAIAGDDNRFYRNVLIGNKTWGLFAVMWNARHEVYNNIGFDSTVGNNFSEAWWSGSPDTGQSKAYSNTFWNLPSHNADVTVADVVLAVHNNAGINNISGNVSTASMSESNFIGARQGYFELTPLAVNLINQATASVQAEFDFYGRAIQNGIKDYGAFEFVPGEWGLTGSKPGLPKRALPKFALAKYAASK